MMYCYLFFREKLLNNVEEEENYNLLEDIYETLNYDCGKILLIIKIVIENEIGVQTRYTNREVYS